MNPGCLAHDLCICRPVRLVPRLVLYRLDLHTEQAVGATALGGHHGTGWAPQQWAGATAPGGQASGHRGAMEHWVSTDHRPCEERNLMGAFQADEAVLSLWGDPGAFGPPHSWRVWIPMGRPDSPEHRLRLSELPRTGLSLSSWLWAPPAGHQGSGASCPGMATVGHRDPPQERL